MLLSKGHGEEIDRSELPYPHGKELEIPVSYGEITVSKNASHDLMNDGLALIEAIEIEKQRRRDDYERELAQYYGAGIFGFGDGWYDEDDEYWDYYDDYYPNNIGVGEYDEYGNFITKNGIVIPASSNKKGGAKPTRFVDGEQIFPPLNEGGRTSKAHHNKKKGRTKNGRLRYEGGTTSRRRSIEPDDIDSLFSGKRYTHLEDGQGRRGDLVLDDMPFDDASLQQYDNDAQVDRCREKKKIIFYRKLNNTADTYEFDSLEDFSDWVDENNIYVRDYVAMDLAYSDESHCCLDPECCEPVLIAERTYEDLVYYITGGDADLLAEYSAKAKYI